MIVPTHFLPYFGVIKFSLNHFVCETVNYLDRLVAHFASFTVLVYSDRLL